MEKWQPLQAPRLIDKKTGREVLTKPPHKGIQWREGHVLRRLTPDEMVDPTYQRREAVTVGDDTFEWVPRDQVEISK